MTERMCETERQRGKGGRQTERITKDRRRGETERDRGRDRQRDRERDRERIVTERGEYGIRKYGIRKFYSIRP